MVNTGIPVFQKFAVGHFAFYERPTIVPVFANQKKCEDFHFYGKR